MTKMAGVTDATPTDPSLRRRQSFRELHAEGTFVMPNPWDTGSARWLASLGFPALATSSAAVAFGRGVPDGAGAVPLEAVLDHVATIAGATDLPVNADFEDGYADDPDGVAVNVGRCVDAGAAGLSVEDSTGDRSAPLYDLDVAVARVEAARSAIEDRGGDAVLTARAECFLTGHPDPLPEALRRLEAYAAAGADVLYAPGPVDPDVIAAIVRTVAPKPVNVLARGPRTPPVAELAALGVRRVSLGSQLHLAAWGALDRAARTIAERGDFTGLADALPFAAVDALFRGAQQPPPDRPTS